MSSSTYTKMNVKVKATKTWYSESKRGVQNMIRNRRILSSKEHFVHPDRTVEALCFISSKILDLGPPTVVHLRELNYIIAFPSLRNVGVISTIYRVPSRHSSSIIPNDLRYCDNTSQMRPDTFSCFRAKDDLWCNHLRSFRRLYI